MTRNHAARGLTRREWMAGTAALGASGLHPGSYAPRHRSAPARIEKIEIFPLRYPTVAYFKFFEGPPGTPPGRPAVLVKITADDGSFGWGESVPLPRWSYETLESAASTLEGYLIPALKGADPFDLHGVHAIMDRQIAGSMTRGAPITKSGIDMALHDLCARARGESLAQRWGRKGKDRLELSWTINPRTLDEIDGLVAEGKRRGYRHFNVKVAPDPTFDVAMCKRVRERMGEGFLWADANGGYDPAVARRVAHELAGAGVDVLEQPVPLNRFETFRALKQLGALPILADEGVVNPGDLIELIRMNAIDGVAMKPARCGGLLPARRQVEILEDAGMLFLGSGLTDPDVSLAATLALYGAYDLKYPAALNGPQFLGASVLRQPLSVEGGALRVPSGPGLGVEVDESKVHELMNR